MANVGSWQPDRLDTIHYIHKLAESRVGEGYSVISGCDVHEKGIPDMDVVVDSGEIFYGDVYKTVAGNNVTISAANGTNDRIDVIYVDNSGVAQVHTGDALPVSDPLGNTVWTQYESPYPKTGCPAGVIIALVYVPANDTSIENAQIEDIAQYNLGALIDDFAPATHASQHKSGGADAIKLDELATPTDVSTLNASTSAHGLLKKLDNDPTHFMNGQGDWATPAGGGSGLSKVYNFTGTTGTELAASIATNGAGIYVLANKITITTAFTISTDGVTLVGSRLFSSDSRSGWGTVGGQIEIDLASGVGVTIAADDIKLENIYIYPKSTRSTTALTMLKIGKSSPNFAYYTQLNHVNIQHPYHDDAVGILLDGARQGGMFNVRIDGCYNAADRKGTGLKTTGTSLGLRNDHYRFFNVRTLVNRTSFELYDLWYSWFFWCHGWNIKQGIIANNCGEITFQRCTFDESFGYNYGSFISIGESSHAGKVDLIDSSEIWNYCPGGELTKIITYGQYAEDCKLLNSNLTQDSSHDAICDKGTRTKIMGNYINHRNAASSGCIVLETGCTNSIIAQNHILKSTAGYSVFINTGINECIVIGNIWDKAHYDGGTDNDIDHNILL